MILMGHMLVLTTTNPPFPIKCIIPKPPPKPGKIYKQTIRFLVFYPEPDSPDSVQ